MIDSRFDRWQNRGVLAAQEQREIVVRALEQLPVHYREILRLRQQENCSFPEIGERTGRSAEAARKLWERAIKQLRLILGPGQDWL